MKGHRHSHEGQKQDTITSSVQHHNGGIAGDIRQDKTKRKKYYHLQKIGLFTQKNQRQSTDKTPKLVRVWQNLSAKDPCVKI